jgi:hypothetical protein
VHLNSTNPAAAAEYYPKPFAASATRATFNGYEAVKTGNVYILFTTVAATPQNELTGPQTSVWHFGWNTPDSRAYNERQTEHTVQATWTSMISAQAINETRFQYFKNNTNSQGIIFSVPAISFNKGAFPGSDFTQSTSITFKAFKFPASSPMNSFSSVS